MIVDACCCLPVESTQLQPVLLAGNGRDSFRAHYGFG